MCVLFWQNCVLARSRAFCDDASLRLSYLPCVTSLGIVGTFPPLPTHSDIPWLDQFVFCSYEDERGILSPHKIHYQLLTVQPVGTLSQCIFEKLFILVRRYFRIMIKLKPTFSLYIHSLGKVRHQRFLEFVKCDRRKNAHSPLLAGHCNNFYCPHNGISSVTI